MGYNNYNGNRNFQGHTFRQGNNGYGQVPYRQNQQPPKKSGATYSKIKKGNFEGGTIVNAWNTSKNRGLITATVAPYHKSEEVVRSEKGHEYQKMMCKVLFTRSGQEKLIPCLMNIKTKVVVLQELGMVITPNGSGVTSSGKRVSGYFGTMVKR